MSTLVPPDVPDDIKKEAFSISCAVQSIVEVEDAEEIQGMLNSVSVLNQVTPENMAEEIPYTWIGLPICYSQRKIKIIGHDLNEIKGCKKIPASI